MRERFAYTEEAVVSDLRRQAAEILDNDLVDTDKVSQREQFLTAHPELRIRIDSRPLQAIVSYDRFLCHPKCSVAHDRSIRGSDIDFGCVISDERVPQSQQRLFVAELRNQGFVASTAQEFYALSDALREEFPYEFTQQAKKRIGPPISFYTLGETQLFIEQGILNLPALMYLAGFSIR